MATSQVTGSDITALRTGSQYISDVALHITPRDVVQSATITAVPAFSPYVSVTVSWDGATTAIDVGQLFEITDGTTLIARGVVRKAVAGNTLFINTTPLGSAGYSTDIERAIAIGQTVTIYTHRPLVGLYSRIANNTFFKQWDLAYTNQNTQPPPVSNVGTWQAEQVETGASASFRLPRVGSNTSIALSGSISSYAWVLPSGVTLKSGYALSDSVIEVDAVAGRYLVGCTVTDSNGNTHTGYTWLFVSDGTTGASFSERYAVTVTSDEQTPQGRVMSFTVTGNDLSDTLYPGAGFLFKEWAKFNDADLTTGVLVDTFVGYLSPEFTVESDGNIETASITVESPFIYAQRIQQPSQVVQNASSPSNWAQGDSTILNPRGILYYACKWHAPAMLDMHDFDAPYTTPRLADARWGKGSLQSAMQTSANELAGAVGSSSDGATVLREKPIYLDNTDRNAIDTVFSWQAQDIKPIVQINRQLNQPLSDIRTGAFAFDGTSTKAWLAQKRWLQGSGSSTFPNFAVDTTGGKDRVLEVVGHVLAEQNRKIANVPIQPTRNQDIVDPAYWLWNNLTFSSEFDALGEGFTSNRFLCVRIARSWSLTPNGWLKDIQLELQPETFGQRGEIIPIQNRASYILNGYSIGVPSVFTPFNNESPFGGSAGAVAMALSDTGNLAITYNLLADSPEWADVATVLNDETVHDFAIDYNSPYYTSGSNANNALRVYVVTTDSDSSTQLNIYRFTDILSSVDFELLETVTMADSSVTSNARIECSETTPTLVIVAFKDQTGTEFIRSTNGGSTWTSKANVGSAITDTANDNAPLGLDVDGDKQLVTAPDGSSNYGLYYATGSGSFSVLGNTEVSSKPLQLVKIVPDTDDAYASVDLASGAPSTETITFNAAVDTLAEDITAPITAPSYGTDYQGIFQSFYSATGGNPDQCILFNDTISSALALNFIIKVSTGVDTNINNLTFDYYADGDLSNLQFNLFVRDGTTSTSTDIQSFSPATATWTTLSWEDDVNPAFFPVVIADTGRTTASISTTEIVLRLRRTTGSGTTEFRIDNVVLNADAPLIGGTVPTTITLYKVTDFDGTDAWTDVSPATDEAPERPHDLAIDILSNSKVNTVSGTSSNWYQSANGASTWSTQESATDKRVFFTLGDAVLVGGVSEVQLALDGSTFDDKTGNLLSAIPSYGTVKRIFAL